jgi:sarcosine oxidase subunit gamma
MLDLATARRFPPLVSNPVVRLLPAASRFILRGGPQVMAAAGKALGLNISDMACRSAKLDARAALWLGPDEQLLLSTGADGPAVAQSLIAALSEMRHSLVDVSHRQIALEVTGPRVQTILNVGCALDLHLSAFPIGMCTRTLMGKADVVLWRTGADSFHVEVWRSFADYVTRFLAEAARD